MAHGGPREGSGRKPTSRIPERLWERRLVVPPGLSERQVRQVKELCERVFQAGREEMFCQIRKTLKGVIAQERKALSRPGRSELMP